MTQVDALEVTSKLGELLDQVEAGEEVAITRRGKVVPAMPAFDRESRRTPPRSAFASDAKASPWEDSRSGS